MNSLISSRTIKVRLIIVASLGPKQDSRPRKALKLKENLGTESVIRDLP